MHAFLHNGHTNKHALWLQTDKGWEPFNQKLNAKLQSAARDGEAATRYKRGSQEYEVDFGQMQQVPVNQVELCPASKGMAMLQRNLRTDKIRPIRRPDQVSCRPVCASAVDSIISIVSLRPYNEGSQRGHLFAWMPSTPPPPRAHAHAYTGRHTLPLGLREPHRYRWTSRVLPGSATSCRR